MELSSRLFIVSILLAAFIAHCLATTNSCGANERSNPTGTCQRTCNACRDCSPCLCKSGYIRSALGERCISEKDCHSLHLTWMFAAKHENKKDKFFNCPS